MIQYNNNYFIKQLISSSDNILPNELKDIDKLKQKMFEYFYFIKDII